MYCTSCGSRVRELGRQRCTVCGERLHNMENRDWEPSIPPLGPTGAVYCRACGIRIQMPDEYYCINCGTPVFEITKDTGDKDKRGRGRRKSGKRDKDTQRQAKRRRTKRFDSHDVIDRTFQLPAKIWHVLLIAMLLFCVFILGLVAGNATSGAGAHEESSSIASMSDEDVAKIADEVNRVLEE